MEKIIIVLTAMLIMVSTAMVILGAYIYFSDEEKPIIQIQLEELKKNYPECTSNDNGEFCCKYRWEGDILMEKECRQFGR